ncbi:MAG TPA: translesion error-prone DNA polymerase V autoproteolytic subunit [Ktedonobacteraceae bacterium]
MPFPSPAGDYEEKRLSLDDLCVPHPISTFFMRVTGDSMDGACIRDGDIIVVDRSITASHNAIVVVRVGELFTVKRLLLYRRKTYLKAENPKYAPIDVTGRRDYEIWGTVTHVVHKVTGSKGNET